VWKQRLASLRAIEAVVAGGGAVVPVALQVVQEGGDQRRV